MGSPDWKFVRVVIKPWTRFPCYFSPFKIFKARIDHERFFVFLPRFKGCLQSFFVVSFVLVRNFLDGVVEFGSRSLAHLRNAFFAQAVQILHLLVSSRINQTRLFEERFTLRERMKPDKSVKIFPKILHAGKLNDPRTVDVHFCWQSLYWHVPVCWLFLALWKSNTRGNSGDSELIWNKC